SRTAVSPETPTRQAGMAPLLGGLLRLVGEALDDVLLPERLAAPPPDAEAGGPADDAADEGAEVGVLQNQPAEPLERQEDDQRQPEDVHRQHHHDAAG